MEHRLILGGEEYLPFARSCIAKLKRLGIAYASQSFEVDGVSIKVRIQPGHEFIHLEATKGNMLLVVSCYKEKSQDFLPLPATSTVDRNGVYKRWIFMLDAIDPLNMRKAKLIDVGESSGYWTATRSATSTPDLTDTSWEYTSWARIETRINNGITSKLVPGIPAGGVAGLVGLGIRGSGIILYDGKVASMSQVDTIKTLDNWTYFDRYFDEQTSRTYTFKYNGWSYSHQATSHGFGFDEAYARLEPAVGPFYTTTYTGDTSVLPIMVAGVDGPRFIYQGRPHFSGNENDPHESYKYYYLTAKVSEANNVPVADASLAPLASFPPRAERYTKMELGLLISTPSCILLPSGAVSDRYGKNVRPYNDYLAGTTPISYKHSLRSPLIGMYEGQYDGATRVKFRLAKAADSQEPAALVGSELDLRASAALVAEESVREVLDALDAAYQIWWDSSGAFEWRTSRPTTAGARLTLSFIYDSSELVDSTSRWTTKVVKPLPGNNQT